MPDTKLQQRRAVTLGISSLAVTVTMNAVVGFLLIVTRTQAEDYTECTAQWQQQFSVAYLARTHSAAEVSEAMDRVLLAVDSQSQSDFDGAVNNYVALREKQNRERANNPLPPLPEDLCGKVGG